MIINTSKPKTLEDIEQYSCSSRYECTKPDDLRTAAKEWITWWKYCIKTVGFTEEIIACYESQIRVFRHFFNLKE